VQVGAFSDHARANKLYQELIARGEDAFLVLLETPSGESLYRVRVGKLPFRQEAEGLARKLSGQGYPTKIIP
jgi:cell division septation protein DedD